MFLNVKKKIGEELYDKEFAEAQKAEEVDVLKRQQREADVLKRKKRIGEELYQKLFAEAHTEVLVEAQESALERFALEEFVEQYTKEKNYLDKTTLKTQPGGKELCQKLGLVEEEEQLLEVRKKETGRLEFTAVSIPTATPAPSGENPSPLLNDSQPIKPIRVVFKY